MGVSSTHLIHSGRKEGLLDLPGVSRETPSQQLPIHVSPLHSESIHLDATLPRWIHKLPIPLMETQNTIYSRPSETRISFTCRPSTTGIRPETVPEAENSSEESPRNTLWPPPIPLASGLRNHSDPRSSCTGDTYSYSLGHCG